MLKIKQSQYLFLHYHSNGIKNMVIPLILGILITPLYIVYTKNKHPTADKTIQ